jgi:hypothetical protein
VPITRSVHAPAPLDAAGTLVAVGNPVDEERLRQRVDGALGRFLDRREPG